MKRNELIFLRAELEKEKLRRKRINELLNNPLVQEFVEASRIKYQSLNEENIYEILEMILKDYKITGTNCIYVCTSSCFTDCSICYQETTYHSVELPIDSKDAEYKIYFNIESLNHVTAHREKGEGFYKNLFVISDFERDNIVLNPYNTSKDENGLYEVRKEFLVGAVNLGQAKAKKRILSKYPRM